MIQWYRSPISQTDAKAEPAKPVACDEATERRRINMHHKMSIKQTNPHMFTAIVVDIANKNSPYAPP